MRRGAEKYERVLTDHLGGDTRAVRPTPSWLTAGRGLAVGRAKAWGQPGPPLTLARL